MLAATSMVQDLEVVAARNMSKTQVAKLYGFAEKLLTTKIDNLATDDSSDIDFKRDRKELVKRCNNVMDSLEKRSDGEVDGVPVTAMGVTVSDDEIMNSSIGFDYSSFLSVPSAKGYSNDDICSGIMTGISTRIRSGHLEQFPKRIVVSRHDPTPYNCYTIRDLLLNNRDFGGVVQQVVSIHTHTAAATALFHSTGNTGTFLLLSFSTNIFHSSFIRVSYNSAGDGVEINYLFHNQRPVATKGAVTSLLSSSSVIVPDLCRALHDTTLSDRGYIQLDGILLASGGARSNAMFSFIRGSIEQAFPDTPVMAPYQDNPLTAAADSLSGDFLSIGTTLVAMFGANLEFDGIFSWAYGGNIKRDLFIVNEPITCMIGLKTSIVSSVKELEFESTNQTGFDKNDSFNTEIFSISPFFNPTSSRNSIATHCVALMDCSGVALNPVATHDDLQNAKADLNLYIDVLQVELNKIAGSQHLLCQGWNDGVVDAAISKGDQTSPDDGQTDDVFLMGPYKCRVLGKIPISCEYLNRKEYVGQHRYVKHINLKLDIRHSNIFASISSFSATDSMDVSSNPCMGWDAENIPIIHQKNYSEEKLRSSANSELFYICNPSESARLKQSGNDLLSVVTIKNEHSPSELFVRSSPVDLAISKYSLAIQWDPYNAILYSNRCAARLKAAGLLSSPKAHSQLSYDSYLHQSLSDAQSCVRIKPNWSKGYSRLGEVLFRQNRLKEATEAYSKAHECELSESADTAATRTQANSSSIQSALREVKAAWDLQLATAAAAEAKKVENNAASSKKQKTTEESSSKCLIS